MRLLDCSFQEPAMNLALDEVLLNDAEEGHSPEVLRFWESPVPFVVLGLTQRLSEEVHEDACARDGIPILRRASGGGCVLQGKGCLNYALVLDQKKINPSIIPWKNLSEKINDYDRQAVLTFPEILARAGLEISKS